APIGVIATVLSGTARAGLALAIAALAVWCVARGVTEFRRLRTPVDPRRPVAALATGGIFARTRHPLYPCQGLLLLALAVAFASDWTVLMMVPWALVMHTGVVLREERYLEARFGDDYRRYKDRVPRYGWPF